uniref:Uncharacterized protein n=1 Tax=Branchiostoma floridae TaxID=7739 RepID=C3YYF1_BRAFL|eukprot:XP_002598579.1 hypothetical protein BRAFLDRAFT_66970 [Branchiostoma floridae]
MRLNLLRERPGRRSEGRTNGPRKGKHLARARARIRPGGRHPTGGDRHLTADPGRQAGGVAHQTGRLSLQGEDDHRQTASPAHHQDVVVPLTGPVHQVEDVGPLTGPAHQLEDAAHRTGQAVLLIADAAPRTDPAPPEEATGLPRGSWPVPLEDGGGPPRPDRLTVLADEAGLRISPGVLRTREAVPLIPAGPATPTRYTILQDREETNPATKGSRQPRGADSPCPMERITGRPLQKTPSNQFYISPLEIQAQSRLHQRRFWAVHTNTGRKIVPHQQNSPYNRNPTNHQANMPPKAKSPVPPSAHSSVPPSAKSPVPPKVKSPVPPHAPQPTKAPQPVPSTSGTQNIHAPKSGQDGSFHDLQRDLAPPKKEASTSIGKQSQAGGSQRLTPETPANSAQKNVTNPTPEVTQAQQKDVSAKAAPTGPVKAKSPKPKLQPPLQENGSVQGTSKRHGKKKAVSRKDAHIQELSGTEKACYTCAGYCMCCACCYRLFKDDDDDEVFRRRKCITVFLAIALAIVLVGLIVGLCIGLGGLGGPAPTSPPRFILVPQNLNPIINVNGNQPVSAGTPAGGTGTAAGTANDSATATDGATPGGTTG